MRYGNSHSFLAIAGSCTRLNRHKETCGGYPTNAHLGLTVRGVALVILLDEPDQREAIELFESKDTNGIS
jgi:hypothetical protein